MVDFERGDDWRQGLFIEQERFIRLISETVDKYYPEGEELTDTNRFPEKTPEIRNAFLDVVLKSIDMKWLFKDLVEESELLNLEEQIRLRSIVRNIVLSIFDVLKLPSPITMQIDPASTMSIPEQMTANREASKKANEARKVIREEFNKKLSEETKQGIAASGIRVLNSTPLIQTILKRLEEAFIITDRMMRGTIPDLETFPIAEDPASKALQKNLTDRNLIGNESKSSLDNLFVTHFVGELAKTGLLY